MDDHMFDKVWEYGLSGLVPEFQKEYAKYGTMQKCPSYEEIKDFCKVLSLIVKWDYTRRDQTPYKPSDLLDIDC